MKKGLIHVYFGDGKGKTTSAIGLGIRALGAGYKVHMAQFLKTNTSNELKILKKLDNFTLSQSPNKLAFFFKMTDVQREEYTVYARLSFQQTIEFCALNEVDLLILDEILDVVALNIICLEDIVTFLLFKPQKLEVVLTGHTLPPKINEIGDYVTQFSALKHPYKNGTKARKGIEF